MTFPTKTLSFHHMLLREMWHSRWNTLACILVITAAVGLYVTLSDMGAASVDATRVLMKEMGFNLQVIPNNADLARYQALDYDGPDMPESYVENLAAGSRIMAQHFVGKLQHTTEISGYKVVLTGVLGQTVRTGTTKAPMPTSYVIPRGEAFMGAAAARSLKTNVGEKVVILGREFSITRILPEYGAIPEDIRVFIHLREAQELLERPGRINAIDALACQCPVDAKDIVTQVRESIEAILPDVQVEPYYSLLLARHNQRIMMERIQLAILVGALIVAAAALWGLTYQNVSARRHEIGVLRALGFSDIRILILFLEKTALYALVAAMSGCFAGRAFTIFSGLNPISPVLTPIPALLFLLPITTLAAMLFCLPPVMGVLLRDPADILGETLP
ncbi:MAG: ABC transporter permease [Candidatus Hydrogenedentes bacterium]|nr:ABC transporter permease [Candidatus Hydrogenedentota bacterium]